MHRDSVDATALQMECIRRGRVGGYWDFYLDLKAMLTNQPPESNSGEVPEPIQEWCAENGYGDPQAVEQHGGRKIWYAFPPGAVMPVPLFTEWWGGIAPVDRDLAVDVTNTLPLPEAPLQLARVTREFIEGNTATAQVDQASALAMEEMTTIVSRRAGVVNAIAGFRVRDFMIREQLSAETLLDYWRKSMVKMTHGRLCRGKKFPKRAENYGRD